MRAIRRTRCLARRALWRILGVGLARGTSWSAGTQVAAWAAAGAGPPAPRAVKERVLATFGIPGAPWVETGTFEGDTTAFLAARAPRVVTLEPMPALAEAAMARFRGNASIVVLPEGSEDGFGKAIAMAGPGDLNFWLDGHFSGGSTFRGSSDTPIRLELGTIGACVEAGRRVAVMIDDVRLFVAEHREIPSSTHREGYPPLDELVDWARRLGLTWRIEHDIFIARSPAAPGGRAT